MIIISNAILNEKTLLHVSPEGNILSMLMKYLPTEMDGDRLLFDAVIRKINGNQNLRKLLSEKTTYKENYGQEVNGNEDYSLFSLLFSNSLNDCS